jgi:hypothetical protein
MLEALIEMAERLFPDKPLLTKEEVAQILCCEPKVVAHWSKRNDADKRPPRLILGSEIRFPKREMMRWVVENQGRS